MTRLCTYAMGYLTNSRSAPLETFFAYLQKLNISENSGKQSRMAPRKQRLDCSRAHKWIRISYSNSTLAKNSTFLKTAAVVEPVSGFESRSVIAYVQNLVMFENRNCGGAYKWIRISVSNCIRAKPRHVLKPRLL
ncbi:hypothetical protein CEXT_521111 [Caerostris extrusa]|uniref:Uncharacterized protein n=1 Tax=Caerostris extrusa TaxID=172846 RepID=A0AAV4TMC9_CAEEX|nr:hypothetical protein CEXT_521111 [Caerostris extrusa]